MPSDRPLLLIDVDGVISLFGFDHRSPPAGRYQLVDGITHFLSVRAGEHLRRLSEAFELAWCTGWEEKANEYLPWALGLDGPLPHVVFDPSERPAQAHWKLGAIDRHVEPSRPVAWIDDAHDERCVSWAASRPAPTLLVTTDPAVGLTEAEVARLLDWATEVGPPATEVGPPAPDPSSP
jgi:HAD domain in Swiss Army Knife RNA repair proteins